MRAHYKMAEDFASNQDFRVSLNKLIHQGKMMALFGLIIGSAILVLTTCSASNPLKQHPESVSIAEGTMANFSCAIKTTNKVPGNLMWRIGSFTDGGYEYNTGDQLHRIEGLNAGLLSHELVGNIYTETVQILANRTLNGTPIECMFEPAKKTGSRRYSKFALLTVTEVSTEEEEVPVTRRSLSDGGSSGDKTTASSGTGLIAAASTIVLTSLAQMIGGN